MNTRYDYLLHATVPADEHWGLPRHVASPAAREGVTADDVDAALATCREVGSRDDLLAYKELNYALALAEGRDMVTECRSRPFVVQVSRTEACNLSCTYCRPTAAHQSKLTLNRKVWQDSLPELLRPALEFIPYCWGEPLMAPDLDLTFEYAGRFETAVSMITNMMHLDVRIASLFVRSVSRALVSIDTPDSSTFKRVRRGGSVERLEANLKLLRDVARSQGMPMPWLGVSAVLLRSHLAHFPDLIEWAATQGFGGVSARLLMIREPIQGLEQSESINMTSSEYRSALASARDVANRHGLLLNVPDPDLCLGAAEMCPCPWHHLYLSASGTLSMCCFSHRDVVGHAPVTHDSWNSPALIAHRKRWTREFRCSECSSLDFVGRVEISQVRGY